MSDEIEDELVNSLNDYQVSINNTTHTLRAQRGKETLSYKGRGIVVFFEQDMEPYKRFVGEIIGQYDDHEVTVNNNTYTIKGKPIKGYPVITRVYISVHAADKALYGVDGDRLANKTIKGLLTKIRREWPALLDSYDAQLVGPVGTIMNVPIQVSGEWVYRYTARFDIISNFVYSEEPSNPADGMILEVSGTIDDGLNETSVREFSTEND